MVSEPIMRKRKSNRPGGECSRFASLVLVTGARNCFAQDVGWIRASLVVAKISRKGEQSAWTALTSQCVGHLSAYTLCYVCRGGCVQAPWPRRFHQKGEQSIWRAFLFSYTKRVLRNRGEQSAWRALLFSYNSCAGPTSAKENREKRRATRLEGIALLLHLLCRPRERDFFSTRGE